MKKTEDLYQTLVPSLKDRFYNQQLNYGEEESESKPRLNSLAKYIIYVVIIFAAVGCFSFVAYNSYKYSKKPSDIESIPLVRKDITPIRTTPIEPGGEQFENQDKLIYDNIVDSNQQNTAQTATPQIETTEVELKQDAKLETQINTPSLKDNSPNPAPKIVIENKKIATTTSKPKKPVPAKKERGISNPFDVLSAENN